MDGSSVTLTLKNSGSTIRVDGTRVTFSPYRCFVEGHDSDARGCLAALAKYLAAVPDLAIYGTGELYQQLSREAPKLVSKARVIVQSDDAKPVTRSVTVDRIPSNIKNVFLCEMRAAERYPHAAAIAENSERA